MTDMPTPGPQLIPIPETYDSKVPILSQMGTVNLSSLSYVDQVAVIQDPDQQEDTQLAVLHSDGVRFVCGGVCCRLVC
jgi:hypothetical protein